MMIGMGTTRTPHRAACSWVMPLLLSVTTAILLIYTIPFVKNL